MANQRKIGTLLSYLHIFVSNSISLIYTPYMLRMMGQSEYGLYGTAASFISYLSILNLGIGGAYIRFSSQMRSKNDVEGEKRLNGMFLTVFSVLSLFVLVGGALLILLAGELVENTYTAHELYSLRIIMFILTINTVFTFLSTVVMMALHAYEKFIVIRVVLLVFAVIVPVLNVIALRNGGKAIAISALSLITSIISYIIFYLYAKKAIRMKFSFKGFKWVELKEIFVFSGFLFLNSITDQLTFSTDNLVLSSVSGTVAVSIYTVGANFKGYFQQFSTSVSSVFCSNINMIVAKNKDDMTQLNDIFIRVGRIQFYIVSLILIGYIAIGKAFVSIWAGADYTEAFYIGLLLMLAVFIPSFQNIGLEIQKAKNMHNARSVAYFLVALINVLLTIPFAKLWGGIGAALATTICMFIGTVLFMNFYYARYIKLDVFGFWKSIISILPGYILPIVIAVVINRYWLIDSYLDLLLSAIAIMCVFSGSIWIFSMNKYEKNLIMAPIKRSLGR